MFLSVTPDTVIAVVVSALALFFDYFPGLSDKFDVLPLEQKRLITVSLAVLIGAAGFIGSCLGWFSSDLFCTVQSGWDFAYKIVLAVAVMYGFHKATKP